MVNIKNSRRKKKSTIERRQNGARARSHSGFAMRSYADLNACGGKIHNSDSKVA